MRQLKVTYVALLAVALMAGFVSFVTNTTFVTKVWAAEAEKSATGAPLMKVESDLEKQVRNIASLLRCPVCQGESIYDSHAEVAVEMKTLIAEKIKAGDTTEQILTYFKDRYGNFILMEPPAEGLHWVIWIFPGFMALLGAMFLMQHLRSSTRAENQLHKEQRETKENVGEIKDLSL